MSSLSMLIICGIGSRTNAYGALLASILTCVSNVGAIGIKGPYLGPQEWVD